MTVGRIKSFPYPERIDSIESTDMYLKSLYRSLTEEQVERITDTENMVIDSQEVGDLTLVTSFSPTVDNTVDIGKTTFRFKDLYLSGSLKDDTVSLTVAHAKDAHDKRVDTWGDGLQYATQTASVDYNTTNLKITSTELDTIQGISTAASPTFTGMSLTGELDITKASTLLIDLNPGFTGTGEVINITPSAALATEDSEWDGIVINGDALDPGVGIIGCHIHGIHIDMSGVLMTREPGVDGLRIDMPATSHIERVHALHANHGIYLEADITTLAASSHSTTIDIVYNDVGSTGGFVHALDVASIDAGAATMVAVGTHSGIDVIHQHIGTATAFDKVWEYDDSGTSWVDVTTACGSAGTDVALWDAQDDVVYFGHATTFDEIICTWATPATKSMHFTFYYSVGSSVFTRFYPSDDTNGGQINGVIRFSASDIGSWATDTVNGTASKYWIKVIRTRLAGTAPTEDTVKFIKGVSYEWNKTGVITAAGLTLTNAITEFSTDGTMVDNSNSAVPTEAAVVTYVAAQITAEDLDTAGNTGTGAIDLNSQSLTLTGTDPIDTVAANQAITISHKTTDGYKHIPTTGASAQILQYSAAGTAKWVTVSSDVSIADGGAMTVANDSHTHATQYQPVNAALTSLASLTYSSASYILYGNTNTLTLRTLSGVLQDLSGNAGASFAWSGQSLTGINDVGCATVTATGAISDGAASTFTTGASIGTLTLGNGSITDSSNAINFGNEALSTTGTLGCGALTASNSTFGTVGCGTITIVDGSSISLQEDITFTGATTVNKINFPDEAESALGFYEGATRYLSFKTTNANEAVVFGKVFTAPTGCEIGNLTLANGSITDSSDAINFGNEALSTTGTLGCGVLTSGNIIIPNAGYIGSVSDTDAIQIETDGDIVILQDLAISGTLGAGNATLGTVGCGDVTVTGNITATGYIDANGAGAYLEVYNTTHGGNGDIYVAAENDAGTLRYFVIGIDPDDATTGQLNIIPNTAAHASAAVSIEAGGNVGIGTTTPTGDTNAVLDIYGTSSSGIFFHNQGSGVTATDGGALQQAGLNAYWYNWEAGFMSFGTSGTERIHIDSAGNVGVGATTFGTNAVKSLGIAIGTEPASSIAGQIEIYSRDTSVGAANATIGLRTEQAVEDIGTFTAGKKLRIYINGVEYWIQLDPVG